MCQAEFPGAGHDRMTKLRVSPQIASNVLEEAERDTGSPSISSARPGAGWEKGVGGNADCLCELCVVFFRNKRQGEETAPSLSHSAQPLLRGKERGRRRAHVGWLGLP